MIGESFKVLTNGIFEATSHAVVNNIQILSYLFLLSLIGTLQEDNQLFIY